jgi:hypothetical protein
MKKIIIWFLIIAVVGIAGFYLARNYIVASAIEKGSTYALGVNAHVGSANLALGAGSLELHDYKLDNPAGYETDDFLSINFGFVDISSGSVFSDTVIVDSLILDDIKINLVQNGEKGNFTEIIEHARKIDFDTTSSTTNVKIRKVAVRNIAVDASLSILNNVKIDKSFAIEDIALTNVGGDDGAGIGEIASIVFQEILKKAVVKGRGQLSDQFGKSIDKLEKSKLEQAGSDAVEKIKDIGGSLFGDDKKKK